MQTLQVIFGLWPAFFGAVRFGIALSSHKLYEYTRKTCAWETKIELAFENSCQNAKQRDRPAGSLSTPKHANGVHPARHTAVKAKSRL